METFVVAAHWVVLAEGSPLSLFSSTTWQWGQGPELTHPGLTFLSLDTIHVLNWFIDVSLVSCDSFVPSVSRLPQPIVHSSDSLLVLYSGYTPHQWDINSESVRVFTVESITFQIARLGFYPHKIRLYI